MTDHSMGSARLHVRRSHAASHALTVLRWLVALVWLASGLGAKVLGLVPRHREIVARVLGDEHALAWTRLGMSRWMVESSESLASAWASPAVSPRSTSTLAATASIAGPSGKTVTLWTRNVTEPAMAAQANQAAGMDLVARHPACQMSPPASTARISTVACAPR